MPNRRYLVVAVFMLALFAALLTAALDGLSAQTGGDEAETSPDLEIRVWQRIDSPLALWISSRPDSDTRWVFTRVATTLDEDAEDDAQADEDAEEEARYRSGGVTVMGARGQIDLQLWQNAEDDQELWLSARHHGGDWSEYGTQEIELDRTSSSGRYRYTQLSITLSEPADVGPYEPGETVPEVCPPGDLSSTEVQMWLWQRLPEQLEFRISSRPDSDTRYTTTMVNMAIQEGGGWRIGDATIGGSEGEIELRVWQNPADLDEVYLSARAADGKWAEYGTKQIDLNRESRSGRYRYAGRSLELTVPDNQGGAPAPGQTVRSWNCVDDGASIAGGVGGTGGVGGVGGIGTAEGQGEQTSEGQTENQAPEADAGADSSVKAGDTLRLDGTGSSDPDDGDTISYSWSAPSGVTLSNATTAQPSFTATAAQVDTTLSFTLTVTDGGGLTDSDSVDVTVKPANRAPEANAGADQSGVTANSTVTLDGSGSSDPDGDTLTYSWSGPAAITLSGADTSGPTFTAPASGSYTFTLEVSDPDGLSDSDTVTVTIQASFVFIPSPITAPANTNNAPTAEAGANRTVAAGATVLLNGSGSDTDGTITGYKWEKTSASTYTSDVDITNSGQARASFEMPTAPDQTLVFKLTVTDNGGAKGSDTVTFTGAPATIDLDAGDDDDVQRGATATLDGTYTDSGATATYKWTHTGGSYTGDITFANSTQLDTSFTVPIAAAADDTIILTLTVSDADNDTDISDTVTITAKNTAPTNANAGTDRNVNRGVDAGLSGSATDTNTGDPLTYKWSHTGGTYTGTISDLSGASPSFTVPTGAAIDATIEFTLTVTDGAGGTDTDTVTITAKNAPLTNVSAGSDRTINRGTTVSLSGTATDPEGTTVTYAWTPATNLTDANTSTPDFDVPRNATTNQQYTFTMTVKDENGQTGFQSATDTVTITAANVAPTVTISGAPSTVKTGHSYTLSASASDDTTSSFTFTWSVSDAGTPPDATINNGVVTIPTNAQVGHAYTVRASSSNDADGASGSASVTLEVDALNKAPKSVEAGAAQSVNQGVEVTLSGSASDDDGDTLTYSWEHTGGTHCPALGSCKLANLTGASPKFNAPNLSSNASKTVIWTLTVSDGHGGSATDTVTITVNNAKPTVSVSNSNVTAGNSFTPSATVNDPDGDNTKITYSWSATGLTITSANSATPSIAIPWKTNNQYTAIGTNYTVYVTVTDEDSAASSEASFTLTVNNRAPNAVASGTSYGQPGAKITLLGSSSRDPDEEDLSNVSCTFAHTGGSYDGTDPITIANNPTACGSATFTIPSGDNGAETDETIVTRLTVTDSKGGTGTDDWTIKVGNAPPSTPVTPTPTPSLNQAPTANAGADQNFKMVSATDSTKNVATVDASGSSDPEGGTLTYSWRARGPYSQHVGLPGDNVNPTKSSVQFIWPSQAPIGGKIEIAVTACDPKTACHTDSAILTRVHGLSETVAKTPNVSPNPNPTPARAGKAVTLRVTSTSNNPDSYPTVTREWYVIAPCATPPCNIRATNVTIANGNTASPTITFAKEAVAGLYSVVRKATGTGLSTGQATASGSFDLTLVANRLPKKVQIATTATNNVVAYPNGVSGAAGTTFSLRTYYSTDTTHSQDDTRVTGSDTDADGDSLTFNWTGAGLTITAPTSDGTNVTIPSSATVGTTYTLTFTVSDGYHGGTRSDSVTVTVVN